MSSCRGQGSASSAMREAQGWDQEKHAGTWGLERKEAAGSHGLPRQVSLGLAACLVPGAASLLDEEGLAPLSLNRWNHQGGRSRDGVSADAGRAFPWW